MKMSEMQIVVFSLNNETCGVESSQVQEIIKYQETARVPRMPKFIEGLISLRGKVVPVVNLNARFDMGKTEITKKTKIIITKLKEGYIGFIVNDVSEIIKLVEEEMELPPEIVKEAGNTFLKSIGKKGDKIISVFNLERILTDNEIKNLGKKKFTLE